MNGRVREWGSTGVREYRSFCLVSPTPALQHFSTSVLQYFSTPVLR